MTPEHDIAICIHAYYVGELDAGRKACERLLSRNDLTEDQQRMVRSNRLYYTQTLGDLVPAKFARIDVEPAREGWSLFNPTLLAHNGELVGIVRSSNYRIDNGRYVMPAEDGDRIRTENILVRISGDAVASASVIDGPQYGTTPYPVEGLEDCRLLYTKTGIGVSATVRNAAPFDGRCRIAVADLDLEAGILSGLRVIASEATQEHEKNWMPIIGRQQWLYACWADGRVVTVDADDQVPGAFRMLGRWQSPAIAREFRGGSQLVPFDDGYLCVVHEVAFLDGRRAYEHRFVFLDAALRLAKVSPAFAFRETKAIEFAAGAAVMGDEVVVSFGVRDAEAWLVFVPCGAVRDFLRPVDRYGVRTA